MSLRYTADDRASPLAMSSNHVVAFAPAVLRMGASPPPAPAAPLVAAPPPSAALLTALLAVPPVRRAVMALGRRKILADAGRIGVPWATDVAALRAQIAPALEPARAALADPDLALPEYYLAPFHAYPRGNLGWEPALEAEVSSRTVHAKFPDVAPLDGDGYLRGGAVDILARRWGEVRGGGGAKAPRRVLDLGCSVGLGTALLKERWPDADVVGVDASAEMLAVASARRGQGVRYVHGLGEALPAGVGVGYDVVSVQLVVHELPDAAMRGMLAEARRVLRPGGMVVVMDVEPAAFEAVPAFVLALFQSTEPYFEDHRRRDVGAVMEDAGFDSVEFGNNTPRHRTYTAFKSGKEA